MRISRKMIAIFGVLGLLLWAMRARAQCKSGYTFTVCPEFDTIYVENCVREPDALAAFRLSTGELKWSASAPGGPGGGTVFGCDLAATGEVVASSAAPLSVTPDGWKVGDDRDDFVQGWDARTGELNWVIRSGETYGIVSAGPYFFASRKSPEGMIVIEGETGKTGWKPPSTSPSALDLYDPKDGVLLTSRYAADAYSGKTLKYWPSEWDVSSATFAGKYVVIGTSSTGGGPTKLVAYSLPSYEVAWMKEDAGKRDFAAVAADADYLVVAIYPRGDVYRLAGKMEVQALASSTGKLLWRKTMNLPFLGETSSSPVGVASGLVMVSTLDKERSSTLRAFDIATGQEKWALRLETIYAGVTCADRDCYLAGVAGKVVAVDVQTVALKWYRIPTQ